MNTENLSWTGSEQDIFANISKVLKEEKEKLKPVNLVVTGKTGTGKSTLINAVFREEIAQVGMGRPVTQHTKLYQREDIPLRIYDTKGLELERSVQASTMDEIKTLISEKWASKNEDEFVHAVWYCINSGSNRVEDIELQWIKDICSLGSFGVPVIVVITQSFRKRKSEALKEIIEEELGGLSLYRGCCVVLASADEDDPDSFPAFGLQELVRATFEVVPDSVKRALVNAQGVDIDLKVKAAKKYLKGYIVSAAATGALPVPWADAPALIANEIAMCVHLTVTFGIDLDNALIAGIATTLIGVPAVTIAGKTVVSNSLKLIPGVGTVLGGIISGGTAALLTAALGRTYITILEGISHGELDTKDIGSDSFNSEIRELMKKEMERHSMDV